MDVRAGCCGELFSTSSEGAWSVLHWQLLTQQGSSLWLIIMSHICLSLKGECSRALLGAGGWQILLHSTHHSEVAAVGRAIRNLAKKGYRKGVQLTGIRGDAQWQWETVGKKGWLRENRSTSWTGPRAKPNQSCWVLFTGIPKPTELLESPSN